MNKFFHLRESSDPKTRSASRYVTIAMVAAFITLLAEVYLALRTGAWQLWGAVGTVILILAAALISMRLLLSGKTERAAQILISSVMLATLVTPFLIVNIGISVAIAGILLTIEIASRATERAERYIIISFAVAVIAILLDLSLPHDFRLVVPELQLLIPVIAGVALIILGYMVVRGFREFSLRIKMIIVILAIVLASVATVAFLAYRSLSKNLTENVGNNMYDRASAVSTSISQALDREYSLMQMLSLDETVQFLVQNASLYNVILSPDEIKTLENQWQTAYAKNDDTDPLVTSVLYNRNATPLWRFKEKFPQNVEVFLTDQQGVLLAATNITSDYYQADEEWWQVAYRNGVYFGPPAYDESTKTTAMIIAIAIKAEGSEKVIGVLRTTVLLDSLTQAFGSGTWGQTGQAVVYLSDGQELALATKEDGSPTIIMRKSGFGDNALNESKGKYFERNYNDVAMLASQYEVAHLPENAGESGTALDEAALAKARAMADLNMHVVVFQELTEARQPVQTQTSNLVVLAFVILIAATFSALGLAQVISGPIIRLNEVAQQVAAGDLTAQAKIETGDETGTLAQTFNSMTTQLRDLVGTLEQRVANRTKALATSAEVSRNLSTILNERQLIIEVVEQLKAAFDYYHVHIYLTDETSGDQVMAGGTGDVGAAMLGSGHRVGRGKGLVGRAAQTNVPVLVSDTAKDPAWLPNPLLPDTKCEAAVPIATADRVLGILDVQDNEVDGVKLEDFHLLQSLANQIAIALLNARSYVEVQQRAEREARITSIGLKIKSTTSIEAALQATARELGRVLSANNIRVVLESPDLAKNDRQSE